MTDETASNAPWLRIIRLFQIRLARLMVLVAIIAILLAAWMYNREYGNSPQCLDEHSNLRLDDRDAARRRQAAENLYHRRDRRILPAPRWRWPVALSDPDGPVRVAAARSLPQASSSGFAADPEATEIDFATMALIPACRDPRDEVRIEAVEAVVEALRFDPSRSLATRRYRPARLRSGQQAQRAVNVLRQAMHDPIASECGQALWSFARVGRTCGEDAEPVKRWWNMTPRSRFGSPP